MFIHTLLWILALLLLAVLAGMVYQRVGLWCDSKLHPPPGRLVDLGTHRLHLLEAGRAGCPTVLLEAGLMSTVLSWTEVQRALVDSYRVVSYDRAGLGWSDPGPMPRMGYQV